MGHNSYYTRPNHYNYLSPSPHLLCLCACALLLSLHVHVCVSFLFVCTHAVLVSPCVCVHLVPV